MSRDPLKDQVAEQHANIHIELAATVQPECHASGCVKPYNLLLAQRTAWSAVDGQYYSSVYNRISEGTRDPVSCAKVWDLYVHRLLMQLSNTQQVECVREGASAGWATASTGRGRYSPSSTTTQPTTA